MNRCPRIRRNRSRWRTTEFRWLGVTHVVDSRSLWALLAHLWHRVYSPRAIRRRLAIRRFYRSKLPRDVYEILHGKVPR